MTASNSTFKRSIVALLALTLLTTAAFAGRVPAPGIAHSRVRAHSSVSYDIVFEGRTTAIIEVTGDGDTDLDIFVYDQNGNLITRDVSSSGNARVRFTPAWTGTFRVVVKNLGNVYNDFVLETN